MVKKDDIILVEEPTFIGGIAAFLANGAKLRGIPMDDDGINIITLFDKNALSSASIFFIKHLSCMPCSAGTCEVVKNNIDGGMNNCSNQFYI